MSDIADFRYQKPLAHTIIDYEIRPWHDKEWLSSIITTLPTIPLIHVLHHIHTAIRLFFFLTST